MKVLPFVLAVGLLPGVVSAQTNDHLWRSYAWSQDVVSPRDAGVAGATAALGDAATLANPAGLGTLTKSEVSGSLASRGSGTFAGRDALSSRTGLGFVGGGAMLTSRWAIGGYVSQPKDSLVALAPVLLGPGASDAGHLEATVTDVAGGVAWSPLSHLHFGLRVNVTHLKLSGEWDQTLNGIEDLRVGTASGSTRVIPSVGALFDLADGIRIGLVATPGASWTASRTAVNPVLGINLDTGSTYSVRLPTTVHVGSAVRANEKLTLIGEVDYVRYSEIRDDLSITQGTTSRSQYGLFDGINARAGAELSLPVGAVSLQVRGGMASLAAGALSFKGADPVEAAAFTGNARQTQGTAGFSVVTKAGVRFDGAGAFGADQTVFLGGLTVRF
jgi:long-subunit fatty acid transport protein